MTYPDYIQKALDGEGARYFSGQWDDTTIATEGFMTPHQISGAAYVPLAKVYTLTRHEDSWYEIPVANWVNERGEPNPFQENGPGFMLAMSEAVPLVEALRKYRAYRRERFTGGLPPEMSGLSDAELQPIRDYIDHMKAKERGTWAPSAQGPGYVPPERPVQVAPPPEPPLPVPTPLSERVVTPFKRRWNRFYHATGDLPQEVARVTVKWNGMLRVRLKAADRGDFGELLGADVNGYDLTLKRHRSGRYYQVKLFADQHKEIIEYRAGE